MAETVGDGSGSVQRRADESARRRSRRRPPSACRRSSRGCGGPAGSERRHPETGRRRLRRPRRQQLQEVLGPARHGVREGPPGRHRRRRPSTRWNDVDAKVKAMVDRATPPTWRRSARTPTTPRQDQLYKADDAVHRPRRRPTSSPGSPTRARCDRVQYGMPFAASTRLLFYNKTLFDRGRHHRRPTTWAELAKDAKALKAKGVKYPYALPLGPRRRRPRPCSGCSAAAAATPTTVGSYSLDSAANVDTFDWLKDDLVGKGLTGPVAPRPRPTARTPSTRSPPARSACSTATRR